MLAYVYQISLALIPDFSFFTNVLLLLFLYATWQWIKGRSKNLPPGPRGLPILGYLRFLEENSYLHLEQLRKKYGDIFRMRVGVRNVVVLCNFKHIKEAFNKEEISDRHHVFLQWNETQGIENFTNMPTKNWKESRKFTLSTLRTLGMGKNKVEEKIMEESQSLVKHWNSGVGKPMINVREYISPTINRIIASMISVGSLQDSTKLVDTFTQDAMGYMNISALGYYFPILKPILPIIKPKMRQLSANIKKMEHLLKKEIENHKEESDKFSKDDFMDHFIAEMKQTKKGHETMTDGILNGNSQVLILGGYDTTLATSEWFFLLMAEHQEVQERVYQEIVRVIGKERQPCWSDKETLPYVDAAITEVWRYKTVAPTVVPHLVTKDTKISGYDIPKGTAILADLHAVHMHPDLWQEPERFNPDRFLTPDGKRAKDPEYFIPFSVGKRACVGEKLARMEIFILLVSILQRFKILPPPGGISWKIAYDIVLHATEPFVKLEHRN